MRVLFIGDVVGGPGRRGLKAAMPELRERHSPDLVIVNGENSAGGIGITEKTADGLFDAGADILTTGNHVYRHREAYEFLDRTDRVIRPANYPHANPGRGHLVIEAGGMRVGVDQHQRRRRAHASPALPSTRSTASSSGSRPTASSSTSTPR